MSEELYPDVAEIEANRLVPIYLMSSYLYYRKGVNVLSDPDFDVVCVRLIDEWDSIDHVHKERLDLDTLRAGTGYDLDYTQLIESSANFWYNSWIKQLSS